MVKASLAGRYDDEEAAGATGTITLNGGDLKFKASITEATLANGPSLNGLSLSVEKPSCFVVDCNFPKRDVKFQFMNTVRVLERPLDVTYTHWKEENLTALDGTLEIDQANKVSGSYRLDSGNFKLKYSYTHDGLTTVEPSYDFGTNAWDFAVSRKIAWSDAVSARYQSDSKVLGLDWKRSTGSNGSFKLSATMNLAEPSKIPTLSAESILNFDL